MATTPDTDLPPIPIDLGPVSDVDHREELERAQRELDACKTALDQFRNRAAAKTTILRRMLDGTQQGKDLLKNIQAVKTELRVRALAAAAVPALPK